MGHVGVCWWGGCVRLVVVGWIGGSGWVVDLYTWNCLTVLIYLYLSEVNCLVQK